MMRERASTSGAAPVVRHAVLVTAMVAIAVAVAVAAASVLTHVAHSAGAAEHDHAGIDVLCVTVAVSTAFVLLTALTVASVGGGRRRGGCHLAWAGPGLGALANASVWASIAALAVASASDAFAALPGGHFTACAAFAGGLGALTGAVHRHAHQQPVYRSFNLVAMLLAAGCLASMSLTDTGEWWARNFSTLGTSDDVAAVWFNAALVLSGGAMAAMAGPLARGLARAEYRPRPRALAVVRALIGTIGFALAGVGLVPIDADEVLHDVFASTAGAAFFGLAAGTPWLVRRMPRRLAIVSTSSLAIEVVAWLVYDRLGWASLTVFEMVAFALVFVWLITLVVTTHSERAEPSAIAAAVDGLVAASAGGAAAIGERVRTAAVPTLAFAGGSGMPAELARST